MSPEPTLYFFTLKPTMVFRALCRSISLWVCGPSHISLRPPHDLLSRKETENQMIDHSNFSFAQGDTLMRLFLIFSRSDSRRLQSLQRSGNRCSSYEFFLRQSFGNAPTKMQRVSKDNICPKLAVFLSILKRFARNPIT